MKRNRLFDILISSAQRPVPFLLISLLAGGALAEGIVRNAGGALPSSTAPTVSSPAPAAADTQTFTYRFARPTVSVASDGLADVVLPGVEGFGETGLPLLPQLSVHLAVPQGRAVSSVAVTPAARVRVASGVTVRHALRPYRPGAPLLPTERNEAVYGSADPYPAAPNGEGATAWKNGVAVYGFTLCPVVYVPASGDVYYIPEITVTLTFAPKARVAASAGPAARTPFISAARAAGAAELVDNPETISGYTPEVARRSMASGEPPSFIPSVAGLPCSQSESYRHVIVAPAQFTNEFSQLVSYRRGMGVSSVIATVEDIRRAYDTGGDIQATIRDFIRDAYQNWGTEYVLIGGDDTLIPARRLYCEASDEIDEIPSDLYYQCLDGDYDYDGDGVYGEVGDGEGGGDIDLYAEVKIGRVPASSKSDVRNWISKTMRYDADCAAGAPYTRGAVYAAEFLGPYDNCYGKPLMEQIRLGTEYTGAQGGFTTYGFHDAPELFDADNEATFYEADGDWTEADLAAAIDGKASVVNHMGHSWYGGNMKFDNDSVDNLRNPNPFFVYSQGCNAGAFDKDSIAEHFTVATPYGAFGGVWNARYGWYQYGGDGVKTTGPSHRFHRRFWDAVFAGGHREIGYANMVSHEKNAASVIGTQRSTIRWVYLETNLFGDPFQSIGGSANSLLLDRKAYRPDGTVVATYISGAEGDTLEATITATAPGGTSRGAPQTFQLERSGASAARLAFVGSFPLAGLSLQHDDTITVEVEGVSVSAPIDAVPPAFADVALRNGDVGTIDVSWKTYCPDKSDPDAGTYDYEETTGGIYYERRAPFENPEGVVFANYATERSVSIGGATNGVYFIRILAADHAGNTNVWNSASPTAELVSGDITEYGAVLVAERELVASFDMERDSSAWTAGSASGSGCWEVGVPTYGPGNASRVWGTKIDGRYPDGANDWLLSPVIAVRSNPTVEFRQWHDIMTTPAGRGNLDYADYGIVEVMTVGTTGAQSDLDFADGAWVNALQYSEAGDGANLVRGTSNVWHTVRVVLPEEFENRKIRLRFRFVSDTFPKDAYPADYPAAFAGNPAGWYIDGVNVYDVPLDGVALQIDSIDDTAGGNGNGTIQPGETVDVTLAVANDSYFPITIPADGATVSVSASGVPSGKVALVGASPAKPSYGGAIDPGMKVAASGPITIAVDASVPPGTPITISQTIVAADGAVYEGRVMLRVTDVHVVSGTVLQPEWSGNPNPNPVRNAVVTVETSDGSLESVTGDDGSFSFDGFPTNTTLLVGAKYGLAEASAVAVAPQDGLEVILPLAEFGLSTNEFSAACEATDADFSVDAITLSNVFVLAAEDGNAGPSCDLEYKVTGYEDDEGNAPEWFSLANPTGSIAPGESQTLNITLSPSRVAPGVPRSVTLTIASNGWNTRTTNVVVTLDAHADIFLTPLGAEATDYYDPKPVDAGGQSPAAANDYDGYLETDEIGQVSFVVYNPSQHETIDTFEATVEVTSGDAEIITAPQYVNYPEGDAVSWPVILPQSAAECERPVTIRMGGADGDVVEFLVSGWACHGSSSNWQEIAFCVTNTARSSVFGRVLARNLYPAEPIDEINGVFGARVTATAADGTVLYSGYTASNGVYSLSGLASGEKYWIACSLPVGSKAVPPFSTCITADSADLRGHNIEGTTYGDVSGHLRLGSVAIDDADGDGAVDDGEALSLRVSLQNDSEFSVRSLMARLTLPPDTENGDCMSISSGETSAPLATILAGQTAELPDAFEVVVDENVSAGAYQRFLLEVWEETDDTEPKRWYFDFAITVSPRYNISGTALLDSGAPLAGVTVKAVDLATGTTFTQPVSAADGTFAFLGVPAGEYAVSIDALPYGYACDIPSLTNSVPPDWEEGADFTLKRWLVVPDASEWYTPPSAENPNGAFNVVIREGDSLEIPFPIVNGEDEERDVSLVISYARKADEVLSLEDVGEGRSAARAALAAAAGNDWTHLDADAFSPGEFEFVFAEGTTVAQRDAYLARHGLKATYHFRTIPASIAEPCADGAAAAVAEAALADAASLTAAPEDAAIVVSAQPSVRCFVQDALRPDDPLYSQQWALENTRQTGAYIEEGGTFGADIGAPYAWDFVGTVGSRDVLVAVTDTGIDTEHPDLAANMNAARPGWNYVYNNYSYADTDGHGTHVAGIIGAVGDNGIGIVGVNWRVRLMSHKIVDGTRWASSARIAQSFEDAYLAGASVNNNSWGTPFYSDVIYQTMKRAQDYDMLFVVSAGNSAQDIGVTPTYPACMSLWLDNVIVVAATDHDDVLANFSSYNPKSVHLAAPGVDILSCAIGTLHGSLPAEGAGMLADDGSYVLMSGTSMAAPYVSGAAALLKAAAPDAGYGFVKDAILKGVRKVDGLADYVSTSGTLDLYNSVRIIGSYWLRLGGYGETAVLATNFTLAAGATANLSLLVNDAPALCAGEYSAYIYSNDALGTRKIPFNLTVEAGAIAEIGSCEVTAEENADGLCSHGEKATLSIRVRNIGSLEFDDLVGVLVDQSGGTVETASVSYGMLLGREISRAGKFKVVFPASGDTADYVLRLTSGGEVVAELPVSLDLFDGSVLTVSVLSPDGEPVEGAEVEVFGAGASRNVTDADGNAILAIGAIDTAYVDGPASGPGSGQCTLRVHAEGYVRHVETVDPAAGGVRVTLENATLAPEAATVVLSIPEGMALTTNVAFTAGPDAPVSATVVKVAKRARVAVFDDGDDTDFLVSRLAAMGFVVDHYTNNYVSVAYHYGTADYYEVIHAPRYTWDDALLLPYDAVVAVLTGENGSGRLLAPLENEAFAAYVAQGGKAFFTGTTPLGHPDNVELAALVGLSDDACGVASVASVTAIAGEDGLGAPFVSLAAGDAFPTTAGAYDASLASTYVSGAPQAVMADTNAPVAKIYASDANARGGRAVVWNGNATDFARDGAALDILRGALYADLVEGAPVTWAVATESSLDVAAGGEGTVEITVNANRALGVGVHEATLLLLADVDDAQAVPVTLQVTVEPPSLRAHNASGSVTTAGGAPLAGDGGAASCIVQLIYAGADGVADPPAADGSAGGDDVVLCETSSGLAYARFGDGAEVPDDAGRFDALFGLAFDGYEAGAEGVGVYARAWDAPSAASAILWGDSAVVDVTYTAGLPDPIDFGSWQVTNAWAGGVVADANGDTVPDAWVAAFRPDLDPRAPVAPLDAGVVCEPDGIVDCSASPNSNADGNTARVFVTNGLAVVVEQFSHRLAVYDTVGRTNVLYFGALTRNAAGVAYTDATRGDYSNAEGGFNQPFGLALDPYSGGTRFAVADRGNSRVELFDFDAETGAITFVAAYGSATPAAQRGQSAPEGTFYRPASVAFMPGGALLVADTENYRVVRLGYDDDDDEWTWYGSYQFTDKSVINGLCYDADTSAGFWVADAGKEHQRVSFHHFAGFSATPVASFGAAGTAELTTPRDVQVWTVGASKRLAVADYQGSRIRILVPQRGGEGGAYTGVTWVADIGAASDASLQSYQKLWLPNGVFPVDGTNVLWVADYGHNQVKRYGLTTDADQDGMDDVWEAMNGLDPTRDDALDDADGDGLANIGEYRVGTDPQNEDTDGDGHRDLWEMENLSDPLDPEASPDEDEPDPGALFFRVTSVKLYDADGAQKTEFEIKTKIRLVVNFESSDEITSATINVNKPNGGGTFVSVPRTLVTVAGNTLAVEDIANYEDRMNYTGALDLLIRASGAGGSYTTNIVAAYTLVDPQQGGVTNMYWAIASISVEGGKAKLTWSLPTANLPSSGDLTFRVGYRASLAGYQAGQTNEDEDPNWNWTAVSASDIAVARTATAGSVEIDITKSPFSGSQTAFFTLKWTNKAKE